MRYCAAKSLPICCCPDESSDEAGGNACCDAGAAGDVGGIKGLLMQPPSNSAETNPGPNSATRLLGRRQVPRSGEGRENRLVMAPNQGNRGLTDTNRTSVVLALVKSPDPASWIRRIRLKNDRLRIFSPRPLFLVPMHRLRRGLRRVSASNEWRVPSGTPGPARGKPRSGPTPNHSAPVQSP
jgi:hypothetical protein